MTGDWQHSGVRIVRGAELDLNTPQTPGVNLDAPAAHGRTSPQATTTRAPATSGCRSQSALDSGLSRFASVFVPLGFGP